MADPRDTLISELKAEIEQLQRELTACHRSRDMANSLLASGQNLSEQAIHIERQRGWLERIDFDKTYAMPLENQMQQVTGAMMALRGVAWVLPYNGELTRNAVHELSIDLEHQYERFKQMRYRVAVELNDPVVLQAYDTSAADEVLNAARKYFATGKQKHFEALRALKDESLSVIQRLQTLKQKYGPGAPKQTVIDWLRTEALKLQSELKAAGQPSTRETVSEVLRTRIEEIKATDPDSEIVAKWESWGYDYHARLWRNIDRNPSKKTS